jgi:hypothetical protein
MTERIAEVSSLLSTYHLNAKVQSRVSLVFSKAQDPLTYTFAQIPQRFI